MSEEEIVPLLDIVPTRRVTKASGLFIVDTPMTIFEMDKKNHEKTTVVPEILCKLGNRIQVVGKVVDQYVNLDKEWMFICDMYVEKETELCVLFADQENQIIELYLSN